MLKKSDKEPNGFGPRAKNQGNGRGGKAYNSCADGERPFEELSDAQRGYQMYKQEYTLLPTQLVFKVEQMTEYERDELLKKWQLDKLLQQRKESEPKPGDSSAAP